MQWSQQRADSRQASAWLHGSEPDRQGLERLGSREVTGGHGAVTVQLRSATETSAGSEWRTASPNRGGEGRTAATGWRLLPGVQPGPFLTNDMVGIHPSRQDNHMWLFAASNGWVFHAGPSKARRGLAPPSPQCDPRTCRRMQPGCGRGLPGDCSSRGTARLGATRPTCTHGLRSGAGAPEVLAMDRDAKQTGEVLPARGEARLGASVRLGRPCQP